MRKMLVFFLFLWLSGSVAGQDVLLDVLRDELQTQYKELQRQDYPPYHLNYRVIDKTMHNIGASFGTLQSSQWYRQRRFVPQVRIGNTEFDNFKLQQMGARGDRNGLPSALLPLKDEGGEDAIRQAVWNETNNRYQFAVDVYRNSKAQQSVKVEQEDKAPCFSEAPVEKYYEEPLAESRLSLDTAVWNGRLRRITAVFKSTPEILDGNAFINYVVERRYFLNNEGTEVAQNLTYCRLMVNGQVKADDGMLLPLSLSYFAYFPEDLPSEERILSETKELCKTLVALRTAPVVDPFTGPALLSGAAAGVFFHEIFGHRVEGQRMKSDGDGQTFKKMVGQFVLPEAMQVFDDPTLKRYADMDLNGYYKYDDQGVKAERVDVVIDGRLNDFLMTRTPIDNHPKSNGHARAEAGFDPVSRQSNLVIETKDHKTNEELRALLLEEVKKQGKAYGYFFKEVTGGLTFTGKGGTNSFNVTPLEVYRIYADGRPDELVRGVDLIGTPLSMFSNIIYAGGRAQVFTGMCGAESGQIPVTAIAPTILVNKVETQRKAKSNDLLPLLPRPEQKQ